MPSKTFSQARMMAVASHDPVFAKKVGVPMKVAKDFNKADAKSGFLKSAMRAKGPAFAEGGEVKMGDEFQDFLEGNKPKYESPPKPKAPPKGPAPKKDPHRGDTTRPLPKMAKGGSVRGAGCETKGLKKASIY